MPKIALPPLQTEPAALHHILGEAKGLSQFGVHIEVLPLGPHSSLHHWHETEDEMIYMLAGEVVLVEGTETLLTAGDVACWFTGHPVGHHLENRSTVKASYLTIGKRKTKDVIHYPDHNLISHKDGDARRYTHADGRPFDPGAKHD